MDEPAIDSAAIEAAEAAGLHYVRPGVDAGMTRRRSGRGFSYATASGGAVRDAKTLARIRGLVIPPAWKDVWISDDPLGHVQATGRDARGRLQYRYHPQWRRVRDAAKYDKLSAFCTAMPGLRRRLGRDLACRCLCRDTVAAAVVTLIERGHLRIGNDEYARANRSYGATTLERRHLKLRGTRLRLAYRGKSGIERRVEVEDAALARVVRRACALPGRRLFQFVEGERVAAMTAQDVNRYLRGAMGEQFSAKDFRTWAATLHCAVLLAGTEAPTSATAAKRTMAAVVKDVAERLGHTPTVCRKSYIDPRVVTAYTSGALHEVFPPPLRGAGALTVEARRRAAERALLKLLEGAAADTGAEIISLDARRQARHGHEAPASRPAALAA
jgi:DNA topoisomerase-1